MSYVRIWVHAVFATKHRAPLLSEGIRAALCEHLHENARRKQLFLDCVNGYHEHLHCLFQLAKTRSVSETIQLLKGESSFWLNREGGLLRPFAWQDDYFAVSVSESQVEAVRRYILRQEEHHRRVSFEEEATAFGRRFGWDMRYFMGQLRSPGPVGPPDSTDGGS